MLTLTEEAPLCRCWCVAMCLPTRGTVFSLVLRVTTIAVACVRRENDLQHEEGRKILLLSSLRWVCVLGY